MRDERRVRFLTSPLATLDACILFQGRLINLLLCIAEAGAFQPIWSGTIHDEWTRNLAASKSGIGRDRIEYRRVRMQSAFETSDHEADPQTVLRIQEQCRTPAQKKDAHVVGTAIAAKATAIVTDNVRDFAPEVLAAYGLRVVRPESFCLELLLDRRDETLAGVGAHRASLVRTPMEPGAYLDYLGAKIGLTRLSAALAADPSLI